MKALIGNDDAVKFIFFRHGSDYTLPTPSVVKKFLGTKSAGFYKTDGHYAGNIQQMSHILDVIHNGLTLDSPIGNWSNGPCYMNSVLRVGIDAKRNGMFDLTHSEVIVDHLVLTKESMQNLLEITGGVWKLASNLKQAHSLIDKVKEIERTVNAKKLIDPSLREANGLLQSDCFTNFAKPALECAEAKIIKWYKSAKWVD